MTKAKIWFLAITAALGGFLSGFDTIVINGAEQDIQKLWNLSGQIHGWVVSAALWGTVIGSIAGGKVSDRFGRSGHRKPGVQSACARHAADLHVAVLCRRLDGLILLRQSAGAQGLARQGERDG